MTPAQRYRQLALEMCGFANLQSEPEVKARIQDCAAVYMQLAETAQSELQLGDPVVKLAPTDEPDAPPQSSLRFADWVRSDRKG